MDRRTILSLPLLGGILAAQPAPAGARQFLIRIEPVREGFAFANITAEEMPILQQHSAYLKSLLEQGKLKLAGQAFSEKGLFGIEVIEAADKEAALAILNADPAVQGKVFRGEVIPFRTVLPR